MFRDQEIDEDAIASALIRRIARGDREAFRSLFDAYHRGLLRFVLRILRDDTDAEEVVQDVFVKVWHSAERYEPERSAPRSWLMMMARSAALDCLRKRTRVLQTTTTREQMHAFDQLISEEAMQSFNTVYNDEWVERLLGSLPESQRLCLELTVLRGFTQAETAARLDRPLGTVKSEIRRGLARLRDLLARRNDYES